MLTGLIAMIGRGRISGSMAKEIFAEMASTGRSAEEIVSSRGVGQISDEETLKTVASRIIDANPDEARKYRSGKTGLLGFFVGQVMKATQGEANPKLASRIVRSCWRNEKAAHSRYRADTLR